MKKCLIIILAVFLPFAFTSCEKDKSAEVIAEYEPKLKAEEEKQASIVKNYEDFCETYKAAEFIWSVYSESGVKADGTHQINSFNAYTLHADEARFLVTLPEGKNFTQSSAGSVSFTSGTVEVENYSESYFYSNKDVDFKDNKLTVSGCTIEGGTFETTEITLTGTLSVTISGTGDAKIKTVDVDLTVGDKTYKASWTINSSSKFTKATVNGQEVELRLLNRAINFGS